MQRSQQNVLLMKILGLKNVRQWLWGSVDSNLPDWSPGYHTAGRGTVRGGSRSVPQRGMGGGTAPFPPVRSLQGWKEAWTLELELLNSFTLLIYQLWYYIYLVFTMRKCITSICCKWNIQVQQIENIYR